MRFPILIFGLCTLFVVSTSATEEESTPFWDMIPVIAQGKSLVQLIFGDKKEAVKTQEHFFNEGLGTSQLRSAYFLVTGEPKTAWNIQKTFFSNLGGVVDGLPIVGHVKGGIHLLTGNHEQGWSAIKSATSTTGAMVGGILGGPAGAIGGHFLTDAIISGTDAVLNGNQSQPHGLVDYVRNIDKLKPGEHFDVIAGLFLDARAGKMVQNKGNLYNSVKVGREDAVDPHELVPLLKNEKLDNQRAVGMPKKLGSMSITEETELTRDEPGPSQITNPRTPSDTNKELNSQKFRQFYNFLHRDQTCKDLGVNSIAVKNNIPEFNELDKYYHDYYLDQLDVTFLKNQLRYLTKDEKTLINKNDFRTVMSGPLNDPNCFMCSLAGILKTSIQSLRSKILKEDIYYPSTGARISECLNELERRKFIKYTESDRLRGFDDLKTYLKANAREFENKNLVLVKMSDENFGHSVVLKMKLVNDDLVMLYVDYQYSGLLQTDFPNPFRFRSYIKTEVYYSYFVYAIEKL